MGAEDGIEPRQKAYETYRETNIPSTACGDPEGIRIPMFAVKGQYPNR